MKCIHVLSLAFLTIVYAKELYTPENDDLDIEEIIQDKQKLHSFVGCFIDTTECDLVSGEFKKDIGEAVQQSCAKCTIAQKHLFNRFIGALKEKMPTEFEAFKNKYDADGKHFPALEKAVVNF